MEEVPEACKGLDEYAFERCLREYGLKAVKTKTGQIIKEVREDEPLSLQSTARVVSRAHYRMEKGLKIPIKTAWEIFDRGENEVKQHIPGVWEAAHQALETRPKPREPKTLTGQQSRLLHNIANDFNFEKFGWNDVKLPYIGIRPNTIKSLERRGLIRADEPYYNPKTDSKWIRIFVKDREKLLRALEED